MSNVLLFQVLDHKEIWTLDRKIPFSIFYIFFSCHLFRSCLELLWSLYITYYTLLDQDSGLALLGHFAFLQTVYDLLG